jgi:hypothetical protein
MIGNNVNRVQSRINYSGLCIGVRISLTLMVVAVTEFHVSSVKSNIVIEHGLHG